KDLDDPNRFRFFGQESYVKSEREMRVLFPDHPEVVAETQRVANLCEFDFEKRYFLPQYPRPAEFASDNDLLVHLARAGAAARYGRDSVGQIITFGTLKARAAFRDVARTLRVEPGEVDRFTKMIPAGPGISVTLAEASEKSPELRQLARQDERVRKILELGTR